MIIGVGSDIVKNSRIGDLVSSYQYRFYERILSVEEIAALKTIELPKKFNNFIAKRFAAKEAFAKAVGTGIGKEVAFKDVSVISDKHGKPSLRLSDKLDKFISKKYGKVNIHVSLTDEEEYSLAFIVIEKVSI